MDTITAKMLKKWDMDPIMVAVPIKDSLRPQVAVNGRVYNPIRQPQKSLYYVVGGIKNNTTFNVM